MYYTFINSNDYGDMGLNRILLLSKILFYQVWLVYNHAIPGFWRLRQEGYAHEFRSILADLVKSKETSATEQCLKKASVKKWFPTNEYLFKWPIFNGRKEISQKAFTKHMVMGRMERRVCGNTANKCIPM